LTINTSVCESGLTLPFKFSVTRDSSLNGTPTRKQVERKYLLQFSPVIAASMAYNEDSSASGHDEPWIQWFCGLKGHEMFCEVERSYIEDGFNLYGLRACVSNFSDCLDLILDRIGPDDSDDSHLTQNACTLYGLIHARYIITAHGLDAMYNKYAAKEFGTCPLMQCYGQPVLPVGPKDEIGADTVKIFCPKCQSVYHSPPARSRSSNHHSSSAGVSGGVDGASFGTTFPHLFLMTFSNLVPDPLPPDSAYIPRVFGFRVHHSARQRNSGNSVSSPTQIVSSRRLDFVDGGDSKRNGTDREDKKETAYVETSIPSPQVEADEEESNEKGRTKGANKRSNRASDDASKQESERPKRKADGAEGGKKAMVEDKTGVGEGPIKRRKRPDSADGS